MEKIKIEELVENIDKVEVGYFSDYSVQLAMINEIVKNFVTKDENGIYSYSSVVINTKVMMAVIVLFSNIELTNNDSHNYDLLMKSGVYDEYPDLVYSDYVQKFESAVDLSIKDIMERNSYSYILADKSEKFIKMLDNTFGHLNSAIDKGDPNTIAKHLSKGIEVLAKKMPDFSNVDAIAALSKAGNRRGKSK